MKAYYNEFDPKIAAWLRELIAMGVLMDGDVDDRSIVEVQASDLTGYTRCHFFAGIGVWDYALQHAGWPADRQVWSGSCPCQPFSSAGNQKGTEDDRHLWPTWQELINECRPETIFAEQVASAEVVGKVKNPSGTVWFDVVQADLERASYATAAFDLPAAGFGAPQIRQRLWFVAKRVADTSGQGLQGHRGLEQKPVQKGRQGTERYDGTSDGTDRLGNTCCKRRRQQSNGQEGSGDRVESEGRQQEFAGEAGGDTSGVGHSALGGVGPQHGQCRASEQPEGKNRGSSVHTPNPTNGFWADPDWLGCRDGKWRPVKPSLEPLVDGASADVVQRGYQGPRKISTENTAIARATRLKGYGNAIVAPVAVEFIKAYMESLE